METRVSAAIFLELYPGVNGEKRVTGDQMRSHQIMDRIHSDGLEQ